MSKPICILVLGTPRSGTTLVSSAIGAHEKICLLDEEFHMAAARVAGGKKGAVKLCIPNHIQMKRKWKWWWTPIRFNGFLRKRVHYALPRSYYSLSDYLQQFDCRIVCILREPVKALAALDRRGHLELSRALRVMNQAYDIYAQLLDVAPDQVAFLSFDRFLQDPEGQCLRICDFVGETFSPEMLEAPKRNKRYQGKSFDQAKVGSEEYDFNSLGAGVVSLIRRYQDLKKRII